MSQRIFAVCFLLASFALFVFKPAESAGKPSVTSHEAIFLGGGVNIHVEWLSPNPVSTVTIAVADASQDLKVDPFDNRRNPSGYAGEITVTVPLASASNQPLTYLIQLEDELHVKSALVKGTVKVPSSSPQTQLLQSPQPSGTAAQSQPSGVQIKIQTRQPPQQPGTPPPPQGGSPPAPPGTPPTPPQVTPPPPTQPGGQQLGTITVTIFPQTLADSGAMWRTAGGAWKKSGEAMSNLPAGSSHTIEFQDMTGWVKPENQQVKIESGQAQTLNGIYFKK